MKNDINKIINKIGIKKNSTLYITGNIFNLGIQSNEINKFCEIFYDMIKNKIKNSGNILVPTATLNLIRTRKIFDKNTKSYLMGVFSEFIRQKKKSLRSSHPLWSFSGEGKNIKEIFKDISLSAYGQDSVFERLLKYKTTFICFGRPNLSIAMLHYAEQMVGVPYRFTKEFEVRCRIKNKIIKKTCLLGVRYNSNKIETDENQKIMNYLNNKNIFKKIKFRKSHIFYCDYKKLVDEMCKILSKRPKIWLKKENIKQNKFINL